MAMALKRHQGFRPLSRDHGVELVCVQGLQRAVRASRNDRIRLAKEMKSVCHSIILNYLEDEARVLLPVIHDRRLRHKFKQHHINIRKLVRALDQLDTIVDPGIGLLARIGDGIDDYVRWEEHCLFPALELTLSGDQLEKVQKTTAVMDNKRD